MRRRRRNRLRIRLISCTTRRLCMAGLIYLTFGGDLGRSEWPLPVALTCPCRVNVPGRFCFKLHGLVAFLGASPDCCCSLGWSVLGGGAGRQACSPVEEHWLGVKKTRFYLRICPALCCTVNWALCSFPALIELASWCCISETPAPYWQHVLHFRDLSVSPTEPLFQIN